MRILFCLGKQVRETLAHVCRVPEHTLSCIPMAVAAYPSTDSKHEGCILGGHGDARSGGHMIRQVMRRPKNCLCICKKGGKLPLTGC